MNSLNIYNYHVESSKALFSLKIIFCDPCLANIEGLPTDQKTRRKSMLECFAIETKK